MTARRTDQDQARRRPGGRSALGALAIAAMIAVAYTAGTVTGVPAQAQPAPAATAEGIAVAGLGSVTATPDVLRISLRVVVVRPDVDAALKEANVVTAWVRAALQARGVAAKDLQSTELRLNPAMGGKPPKIVGYQVVQGLTAQLRDLTKAGATVTDTIRAGGTSMRFDGIVFSIADDQKLKVQARDLAFAQAKDKAEQHARLAGRTLGPVRLIEEDLSPRFSSYEQSSRALGTSADSLSFSPGTQRVEISVVVRWSLL